MSLEEVEKELFGKRGKFLKPNAAGVRAKRPASPIRGKTTSPISKKSALVVESLEARFESSSGDRRVDERRAEGRRAEDVEIKNIEHTRLIRKALLGITLASVLIIIGGTLFIFNYGAEGKEVELKTVLPDTIERGVPFEISFEIKNSGESAIKEVDLRVSPSAGLVSLSEGRSGKILTESIGDLGSGSLTKRTLRFLPISKEGTTEKISASLGYSMGSSARFETSKTEEIIVKNSPLKIKVNYPEKILGGSEFVIQVEYENASRTDFLSIFLEATYPSGFHYVAASLKPDVLNNEWHLGALKAGSKGTLDIRGSFEGSKESSFAFPVAAFTEIAGKRYEIAQESAKLDIASSPVAFEIILEGVENRAARLGEELRYKLKYQNSSGVALQSVVIESTLQGEMFDFSTLQSNGVIDLARKTILWDVTNVPGFHTLDPEVSGEVSFSIRVKNQFPITKLNDKNFSLKVLADLTSPSVPFYVAASKTRVIDQKITKVAGALSLDARAFYRDVASGIANNGPFPPKADQKTEYTIHWVIRNFGTDMGDVVVKAILPLGVSWKGVTSQTMGEAPNFNAETREVLWSVGKIPATKGVIGDPVEAVFQIEATPSVGYVGIYFPLVQESVMTATDEFVGTEFITRDGALSTDLVDDPTVSRENGRVTP